MIPESEQVVEPPRLAIPPREAVMLLLAGLALLFVALRAADGLSWTWAVPPAVVSAIDLVVAGVMWERHGG